MRPTSNGAQASEHRLLMQADCPLLLCLGAEWWLRKLKEGGSASFGDSVPVLESRFLTVSSWVFICKRASDLPCWEGE